MATPSTLPLPPKNAVCTRANASTTAIVLRRPFAARPPAIASAEKGCDLYADTKYLRRTHRRVEGRWADRRPHIQGRHGGRTHDRVAPRDDAVALAARLWCRADQGVPTRTTAVEVLDKNGSMTVEQML